MMSKKYVFRLVKSFTREVIIEADNLSAAQSEIGQHILEMDCLTIPNTKASDSRIDMNCRIDDQGRRGWVDYSENGEEIEPFRWEEAD